MSKTFRATPISIVVPLFRSNNHLDGLVTLIKKLSSKLHGESEVILINDGDPEQRDASLFMAFQNLPIEFQLLHLNRNMGQMVATVCGMQKAKHPLILTLDADIECDTEKLIDLIALTHTDEQTVGYLDYTIGADNRSFLRRLMSRSNHLIYRAMVNKNLHGHVGSSVRVVHHNFINHTLSGIGCPELLDVLLLRHAVQIQFVQVERGKLKTSSYTTRKILELSLKILTCLVLSPEPFSATDYLYDNETRKDRELQQF